jgi:hypothetical protein
MPLVKLGVRARLLADEAEPTSRQNTPTQNGIAALTSEPILSALRTGNSSTVGL